MNAYELLGKVETTLNELCYGLCVVELVYDEDDDMFTYFGKLMDESGRTLTGKCDVLNKYFDILSWAKIHEQIVGDIYLGFGSTMTVH